MKFTAQEEYGLRCALNLARAFSDESAGSSFMTVGTIAGREGLSAQYVGKLFRVLAKAGLVESVRGCKGGYKLTRPPELISVDEVLTALGGKLYEPKICDRYAGDRSFCVHTNECSIRSLWSGLQLIIDAVLSKTTLADLVDRERPMAQWIEESVGMVGEILESLGATATAAASARGEQAGSGSGFSGREIPVLRGHDQRT